ncbi:MAG: hypothetical protein O3A63_03690, partial [Proteobacteria bacterium]|nr:hypothetical protein [Pseudomonadota bacterium]
MKLLLAACVAGGCALIESPPPEQPAEPVLGPVQLADAEPEPVAEPDQAYYALLDSAEAALQDDHLTYPYDGSAWQLYERALRIIPDNTEAIRGVERIAERYVTMAMEAAQQRSFGTAKSMLQRAKLVNPDNPTLNAATAQISLLEGASRTRVVLDKQLVSGRSQIVSQSLHTLGSAAR